MLLYTKPASGGGFVIGINFRATASPAGITDPPNTYGEVAQAVNYPTSRGGTHTGYAKWSGAASLDGAFSQTDGRLSGFAYTGGGPYDITYRIDVPAAGSYIINAALGDGRTTSINHPGNLSFFDGSGVTPLLALTRGVDGTQVVDATGTEYSAAAWLTANPPGGGGSGGVAVTLTSTYLTVGWQVGTYSGDPNVCVCHVMIRSP